MKASLVEAFLAEKEMDTLRELVESKYPTGKYVGLEDHIRFELNHLELHGMDDYLFTCFNKGIKDVDNINNSNIKYLIGMSDQIRAGPVETVGGSWPD